MGDGPREFGSETGISNALIEAGKPHDLMIMRDENQGMRAGPGSRPYGRTYPFGSMNC